MFRQHGTTFYSLVQSRFQTEIETENKKTFSRKSFLLRVSLRDGSYSA